MNRHYRGWCYDLGGYVTITVNNNKDYAVIVKDGEDIKYVAGFDNQTGVPSFSSEIRDASKYTKNVAKDVCARVNGIGYLKVE